MKEALKIKQQIELLRSKGLVITEETKLKEFLMTTNYYRLSGYMKHYMIENKFINNISDTFLINIYSFDSALRNLINDILEFIEISVKSHIAYFTSTNIDPVFYIDNKNFISEKFYQEFMNDISEAKNKRYKLDETVIHHKNTKQELPIWALVEILTLGSISKMYKNMRSDNIKESISQTLINLNPVYLENYIHCLNGIRNKCAHRERLYGKNNKFAPKLNNEDKRMLKSKYQNSTHKIFIYVYIMFKFVNNEILRNKYVQQLKEIIFEYNQIDLSLIGFPINWEEILDNFSNKKI